MRQAFLIICILASISACNSCNSKDKASVESQKFIGILQSKGIRIDRLDHPNRDCFIAPYNVYEKEIRPLIDAYNLEEFSGPMPRSNEDTNVWCRICIYNQLDGTRPDYLLK